MTINKSESRQGTPITLILIHTNEGNHSPGLAVDHTAEDLATYLDQANAAGDWKSYHKICDDDSTVTYVPDSEASWSALAANMRSLNLCLTGWAHWSRAEWLTHDPMLRRAAIEVAGWCHAHNIPPSKLAPVQVGANQRGCCGHGDWTIGKGDGTHTDPGPEFPWDLFLSYVTGASGAAGTTTEEPMIIPGISLSGAGRKIFIVPVGTADGYSGRKVTISVAALDLHGPGHVEILTQSDDAGIEPIRWTEADLSATPQNNYPRKYHELKSGVTKLAVSWDFTKAADATMTLEILATR